MFDMVKTLEQICDGLSWTLQPGTESITRRVTYANYIGLVTCHHVVHVNFLAPSCFRASDYKYAPLHQLFVESSQTFRIM